jgi:hypothetical protein
MSLKKNLLSLKLSIGVAAATPFLVIQFKGKISLRRY